MQPNQQSIRDPSRPSLVVGAAGFLGSHLTRKLVALGQSVRVLVRSSSNTIALDDLPVQRFIGDVLEARTLPEAMQGCGKVYHCVVDTRAWLRDPTPLYRTNVDGLVNVMDAALAANVDRFVLTSTIGTIGRNPTGIATEQDEFNWWEIAPAYIRARVKAELAFFDYCRERGLPGIACCVANTYGPGDFQPTPHGRVLAAAAQGKIPYYLDAISACVGVGDAADAMILAANNGRIGERYIVSDKGLSQRQLFELALEHTRTAVNLRRVPLSLAYTIAWFADVVSSLRRIDNQLSVDSIRLSHVINDMDASKARQELGWSPRPVEESIRAAIDFYLTPR